MAVSIDNVYQKVLAISNKEKRGYITPLEFNLFANQAQLDIFNQYFYDLGQFSRLPSLSEQYINAIDLVREKVSLFEVLQGSPASIVSPNLITINANTFELGDVYYFANSQYTLIEKITQKELLNIQLSPLATPTINRPVYVRNSNSVISIFPSTLTINTDTIKHNYIKKPIEVQWAYTIINDQTLYNSDLTTNFELHQSEESSLVIKILELSGMTIKDPDIVQFAAQQDSKNIQQEKS